MRDVIELDSNRGPGRSGKAIGRLYAGCESMSRKWSQPSPKMRRSIILEIDMVWSVQAVAPVTEQRDLEGLR